MKTIIQKCMNAHRSWWGAIGLVGGIYFAFLMQGILQERIYKKYRNPNTGKRFDFPLFLVTLCCVVNALVAFVTTKSFKTKSSSGERGPAPPLLSQGSLLFDMSKMACSYMLAMVSTNVALAHVSYPTMVIFKSAKSVPVIVGSYVLYRKKFPMYDWIGVMGITAGVSMFNLIKAASPASLPSQESVEQKIASEFHGSWWGYVALVVSLLCDAVTGPTQDKVLSQFKMSGSVLILYLNSFASLLGLVLVALFEGFEPLRFIALVPEILRVIIAFALLSIVGQWLIVQAVISFGSLYVTLITTTRKFFTVMLSILLFEHAMTQGQWVAVGLVFGSLLAQSLLKHLHQKRHKQKKN